jgi:hypothetical protein
MPVFEGEFPHDKLFQKDRVPPYLHIAFHPGLLGWTVDTDMATKSLGHRVFLTLHLLVASSGAT